LHAKWENFKLLRVKQSVTIVKPVVFPTVLVLLLAKIVLLVGTAVAVERLSVQLACQVNIRAMTVRPLVTNARKDNMKVVEVGPHALTARMENGVQWVRFNAWIVCLVVMPMLLDCRIVKIVPVAIML
jgi:hypothetical protein